jgi:acylphosphatase
MPHSHRLHARIEGRVQGVGFRYFVRESAAGLAVTGWVRNLHDGNVELVAEGDQTDLDKLLSIVKEGPRGALVTNVRANWETATGEFEKFLILPTA